MISLKSFLLFITLISFSLANAKNQIIVGGEMVPLKKYISEVELDSLKHEYGQFKKYPDKFGLQILIALSYYPELKNIDIEFVEKKAFAPLSATPSVYSMLSPFGNRKYKVVISSQSNIEMERILLKNLPINAQIGVLGHELAHVADYDKRSFSELIAIAINYGINPVYHAWYEKNTDLRAVDHGLGWELYAYSRYVRTLFGSTDRDVNLSDDFYLHYNEILFEMQKSDLYNIYFQPNSIDKN